MKIVGFTLLVLALSLSVSAQTTTPAPAPASTDPAVKASPVFRATKDQVKKAQAILKERKMYDGEESGKLDDATRMGLQKYQLAENLKITGTLNQATVEKMSIPLTDSQKGIKKPEASSSGEKKPAIFRSTKEQITEAQTLLKGKGFYNGEANGKLDEDTREGIRKYQATNGVKVTGTLNRETLEHMSIQLTEKQKAL